MTGIPVGSTVPTMPPMSLGQALQSFKVDAADTPLLCRSRDSAKSRLRACISVCCVAAGPAIAQGRSDSAPGKTKDKSAKSPSTGSSGSSRASQSGLASPITSTTSTSAPAASANSVVYYGSWLDDASIVAPGDVWVGLATGYWRGDSNRQIDAPVMSAAVGITPRVQAGGSASFYHFRDADGISENGFGMFSLYGKFQIADAARAPNAIGVAVTPLIELSPGSEAPVGWALPVNLETHRGDARIYGSAGYFSRGSLFGTIGVDIPADLAHLPQRHVRPVVREGWNASNLARRRGVIRSDIDKRSLHRAWSDLHALGDWPRRGVAGGRHVVPPTAATKALNTAGYTIRAGSGTDFRDPAV